MAAGDDLDQPDGQAAREIVGLMEQNAAEPNARPFFLALGLRKPHNPWIAPKKYFDFYSLDQCAPNLGPADDLDDVPPVAFPSKAPKLNDAQAREFLRGYYACNSFMNAQVGTVLSALDRLKLTGNTLVVFLSDHGYHLGEHAWRVGQTRHHLRGALRRFGTHHPHRTFSLHGVESRSCGRRTLRP